MPNVEIDGTNSTVKTNVLTSQSGTAITVPTGKVLTVTDAAGLTINGVAPLTSIAADSVDGTKIADNAVDSEHYTDGSIDEAHIANDAVNFVTHLKAGTDGELITWDASGNPAAVAVGTATHVLTSGGAGVAPTFQAAAGGGKLLQMIGTTTGFTVTTITSSANNTWVDTSVLITFTPLSSTSRFMVSYGIGIGFTNSSGDGGYSIRIKRVQSGTTTYPYGLSDYAAANLHSRVYCSGGQTNNMPFHSFETNSGTDLTGHTTASITYTVQGGHYNAESLLMGNHYNTRPNMVVLEVEV